MLNNPKSTEELVKIIGLIIILILILFFPIGGKEK